MNLNEIERIEGRLDRLLAPQQPELQQGIDNRVGLVAREYFFNMMAVALVMTIWVYAAIEITHNDRKSNELDYNVYNAASLITFLISMSALIFNNFRPEGNVLWVAPLVGSLIHLFYLEKHVILTSPPILEVHISYSLPPFQDYLYISGKIGNLHLSATERDQLIRVETAKLLVDRFQSIDECFDRSPVDCRLEKLVSFFPYNLDDIAQAAGPFYPPDHKLNIEQLELKQEESLSLARDIRDTRFNHLIFNNITLANPDFLPKISKDTYEKIDTGLRKWIEPKEKLKEEVIHKLLNTVWGFVATLLKNRRVGLSREIKTQKELFRFRTFHLQEDRLFIQELEYSIAAILQTKEMLYARQVTREVLRFLATTSNLVYFHHDPQLGYHIVC